MTNVAQRAIVSDNETCDVCGRPLDNTAGNNSDAVCWRDVLPPKDGDYWNEEDARRCYQLGYERASEALAAARRDVTAMQAAIAWACGEAPLPDGRWFDPAVFGHTKSVPRYWWRAPLRLYSALAAPAEQTREALP